jgi:glutaredoxin
MMSPRSSVFVITAGFLLATALVAQAQLYRWIDERGRVQYSDTPPPPGAKQATKGGVPIAPPATQTTTPLNPGAKGASGDPATKGSPGDAAAKSAPADAAKGVEAQVPFEVARAQKSFPVTLYTSPTCKQECTLARGHLNARGIPFREVQVWDEDSNALLRKVIGSNSVPSMTVGKSIQDGYEPGAVDALLDSAGYPKAGSVPVRSQPAPPLPQGYLSPDQRAAQKAEPAAPEKAEEPAPTGPYAPGSKAPPPRRQAVAK